MNENSVESLSAVPSAGERACAYRILRYTPNLVRDEWVNIGVLLFDPGTGERRLRLIEERDEYNRVRRLHPQADEALLRALRDDLEDRFQSVSANGSNGGIVDWQQLLGKWDDTLSNALQLAPQKGVFAADLDAELERLYADHVATQRPASRVGAPGSRAQMRSYCSQVLRQAHLWERIEKSVLQLPAQRHARFRAESLRHARTRRRQAAGLHGGAHHGQGCLENRIYLCHRCRVEWRE